MGRKSLIAAIAAVFLLLAGAVGVYAYDASKEDEIAEGIRIAGVDVSGMSPAEARSAVRADVVEPLDKPVTVTHQGTRYVLHPKKLGVSADINGMVDQAIEASREDALPTRVWRYVTGGEVNETIEPTVSYSEKAIDEFVQTISADLNREPVDAHIEASPSQLTVVGGEDGRTVRADELRENVEKAVQDPDQRKLAAQVDVVKPEVTKDEVAGQYPTYLTVDRSSFQLKLWENLKLAKTYPIAVGAVGWETPSGEYSVQNKAVDPAWSVPEWGGKLAGEVIPGGSPQNPLKERWLGIYDGAGIHGTDDVGSLGSAASHGCVRMAIPDVIELYEQVDVGTPVYIG